MDIDRLALGGQKNTRHPGVQVGLQTIVRMGTQVQQAATTEQLGHHDVAMRMGTDRQITLDDTQSLRANHHLNPRAVSDAICRHQPHRCCNVAFFDHPINLVDLAKKSDHKWILG